MSSMSTVCLFCSSVKCVISFEYCICLAYICSHCLVPHTHDRHVVFMCRLEVIVWHVSMYHASEVFTASIVKARLLSNDSQLLKDIINKFRPKVTPGAVSYCSSI